MMRKCRSKFDPKSNGWDEVGRIINWHPKFQAKVTTDSDGNDLCLIVYFDCPPSKASRFLGKFNGFRVSTIGGSVAYLIADTKRRKN